MTSGRSDIVEIAAVTEAQKALDAENKALNRRMEDEAKETPEERAKWIENMVKK